MINQLYFNPIGGLPDQSNLLTDRALFTEAYVVIPKGSLRDIVTSKLPAWTETRAWILAKPLSGFSTSFSHYIVEVDPGGGSSAPDYDKTCEAILFVTGGCLHLTTRTSKIRNDLSPGSYVYLGINDDWTLSNHGNAKAVFHWFRKSYKPIDGTTPPRSFVSHEHNVVEEPMPNANNTWTTKRFVDVDDLSHDMHVNIVSFLPGGKIPFIETHVMEHGIYVLEGNASYRLNDDWVEVEAGDYIWLRSFCPQACYAVGTTRFRYLLYKDVNRHADLTMWCG